MCPIDRRRKAAVISSRVIHVGNDGDSDQCAGTSWLVGIDHQVGGAARDWIGLSVAAREIPVCSGIAGVYVPVVARGGITAPAHIWNFYFLREVGIESIVRDSIDIGIDRVLLSGSIDRKGWGGLRKDTMADTKRY